MDKKKFKEEFAINIVPKNDERIKLLQRIGKEKSYALECLTQEEIELLGNPFFNKGGIVFGKEKTRDGELLYYLDGDVHCLTIRRNKKSENRDVRCCKVYVI
jgi:hypothetical protein